MVHEKSELGRHWKTVVAAMIGVAFGPTGVIFYTLGLFMKPLSEAFGWSRAETSAAGLCLQGGLIVMSPAIGVLIDRYGPRRIALLSLAGTAIGLLGLTMINAGIFSLYLAWIALALLSSGATPIVWTRAINRCFSRQRGIALGLSLSGTGLAAILAPWAIGLVIATYGWRFAYLVLAVVTLCIALPVVSLFLEDGRADMRESGAELAGSSLREAMATGWFWRCGLSFFLVAGGLAALIVHLAPLLQDQGLTNVEAGSLVSMLGLSIIIGRLAIGFLVDRLPAARVGMAFLLFPAIACVLLVNGPSMAAVLMVGLAAGAEVDLLAYLVSGRFGMHYYGRIYGWQLSAFLLGAGIAPIVMGAARDRYGSYDAALYADAVVMVIGAIGIASLHGGARWRRTATNPA